MLDACDPDADIENLRQLIKLNTGVNIKLTKSQICQAYDEIQGGKLPLPPLVMSSDRTYLVDKKSPLKPKDYELLFDATTKRVDLKRIARKVGLKQVEQKTKSQIVDAIGKRLRYMKIHEPVKFARRAQISVNRNTAVNNTAVNVNVNTTNINRVNTNINRVNTNVNRVNTNVNRVNTNVNRVNTNVNRVNTNVNRVNTNVNRVNVNRVNTNRVNRPKNSKLSLPSGGLFMRGAQPKFLGGTTNAVKQPKEKRGFFASLFGKKENKNFIASNRFKESKEGYVFRKGEKGLGYYLNTGRIQGPQIPSANTIQPTLTNGRTGNNISLDLATAQIKQLGLKREQKFLSKLEAGGVQRKRVIAEAEQAKQEENELVSFLEGLNLNNTNRNTFVRRMTTDDFKQIKSEAQIKAGKNGMTNEQKMSTFLESLTMNNANKNSFMRRVREEGSNVNALIEEAKSLVSSQKNARISKKKEEFQAMITNLKLNNSDKNALMNQIENTTNLNTMKNRAQKLVEQRMAEKKEQIASNLASFLTPLKINQSNKNTFLRRFKNENANINSIKSEALALEKLALNIKNTNAISNKKQKLQEVLNKTKLSNVNKDSFLNRLNNKNANMNTIIKEIKALNTVLQQKDKNSFVKFLNELGLDNADKSAMISKYESKTLTINALQNNARALKKAKVNRKMLKDYLESVSLSNDVKANIERRFNSNEANLNTLRSEINGLIKKAKNTKLAENKQKFVTNVRSTILSPNDQNVFIRRLNTNNVNIPSMRLEVNQMVAKMIEKQKSRDRYELEEYMKTIGLSNTNRNSILGKFDANNKLTVESIKKEANAMLQLRKQEQRGTDVDILSVHAKKLGLPQKNINSLVSQLERESLNSLIAQANRMSKNVRDKRTRERDELYQYINKLNMNVANRNAIMNKFNTTNATVNRLKNEAGEIQKSRRSEKRSSLREFLDTLELSNSNKRGILNKFNANQSVSLNALRTNAAELVKQRKNKKQLASRLELVKHLNTLDLSESNKGKILKNFNGKVANLNTLKNRASQISAQRKELSNLIRELGINGTELLKRFDNKVSSLNNLKANAKKMRNLIQAKSVSNKKDRLRDYMKNTRLTNTNKQSFINRVEVDTNIETIKREIQELNTVLKGKNTELARKKSELSIFLNGLSNLTPDERKMLMTKVVNANTNINSIKNEGQRLNQSVKNKRKARNQITKNVASKLQSLTNLDRENRKKFMNRLPTNGANAVLANATALNQQRKTNREQKKAEEEARRKALENNKRRANDERKARNQITKNVASKLQSLTNLERENRKKFMNRLPINGANAVIANATALDQQRKTNREQKKAEEEAKRVANEEAKRQANEERRARNQTTKNVASKLQGLTNLKRENRKKFMNRLPTNGANTVIANATALNQQRKTNREQKKAEEEARRKALENNKRRANEERRAKNQITKNVASKLQSLTNLKRENRKKFMNRLATNGANKVVSNATALNAERKSAREQKKAEEEAKRKAEEEAKRQANEERRVKNQMTKNVASKLQSLTNLKRENRKRFMNRLPINGANKVVSNATALNAERKSIREQKKAEEEARRKALEEEKRRANEERKAKNQMTKNVASKLQSLTNLKRENRKKFMNRLPTNGANKVVSNATALNQQRKTNREQKKAKEEAKRQAEEEAKRQANEERRAKNQMTKNVASKLQSLTNLGRENRKKFMNRLPINGANKVVSNATALNAERKSIREQKKAEEEARRKAEEEAKRKAEEERKAKNQMTKNVASKLQSLTNLKRENRKKFMNRLPTNGANKVVSNAMTLNAERKSKREAEQEARRVAQEAKRKAEEEAKRRAEEKLKVTKEVASKLQGLTSLERANRKRFMNRLTTNGAQKVVSNATALNAERKAEQAAQKKKAEIERQMIEDKKKAEEAKKKMEEAKKRSQNLQTKRVAKTLQGLTSLERANRKRFMNRLATNGAQKVVSNATALNAERKSKREAEEEARRKAQEAKRLAQEEANKERKAKNQMTKEVASKLQSLTSLNRTNRKRFMNRLATNGAQKVVSNATALNQQRKSKRKAEEDAKRKAEEERKVTKEVASKLQGLTSLERTNRKRFMNRLATNGAQKVVSNATALNQQRKSKRKAEEELKVVASKLQGLTSLERENRKKFMNRLATNGAQKVVSNATALDTSRKAEATKIRNGVEWKLKKIGVSGSNLAGYLKRWNTSKNQTIFNDARKKIMSKRAPLLSRIQRDVPAKNNYSKAQVDWKAAILAATNDTSLKKIEKLLDDKLKLKARTESEVKNLPWRQKDMYLKNFMAYRNDVSQKSQVIEKLIRNKKTARDTATKEVAQKLQVMDTLGRDNRKRFMNRIAGGEDASKVLTNADKLQRDRTAKQRVEAERKKQEQAQAQRRKDEQKRKVEAEKAKVAKLRRNTAQLFQGMSGLERKNRQEFMRRLEKGEDPARVLANAKARDAAKGFSFNKRPAGQVKTMSTQARFGEPTGNTSAAKKQIYGMRGMGAKNQQSFIRRIERGEDASRVLRDARAREQMLRGRVSRTKQQLQYNTKVRSVVRRL
jgi:hypothetical protein